MMTMSGRMAYPDYSYSRRGGDKFHIGDNIARIQDAFLTDDDWDMYDSDRYRTGVVGNMSFTKRTYTIDWGGTVSSHSMDVIHRLYDKIN